MLVSEQHLCQTIVQSTFPIVAPWREAWNQIYTWLLCILQQKAILRIQNKDI